MKTAKNKVKTVYIPSQNFKIKIKRSSIIKGLSKKINFLAKVRSIQIMERPN